MEISVICTDAAKHIGQKLATDYGFRVIIPKKNREDKRFFPDGEVYNRIPEIKDLRGEVIVLHSGAPAPNDGLVQLEQILVILKRAKIRPIVFFLYFPYGKQDQIFVPGETNAAEDLLQKLTKYYRVKKIYTIDVHFSERKFLKKRDWLGRKKYPLINYSVIDLLKQAALKDYPGLTFLTPDKGGQRRTGLKGTLKKRLNSFTTEIQSDEDFRNFVRGKRIGAIDDLLQTGGTLANFYDECIKHGALEVVALLTHGVIPEGIVKIVQKYSKLYLTNTIDRKEANIDVIGLVADVLRGIAGR